MKVWKDSHILHTRTGIGTYSSTDGHHCAPGGEVRQGERKHEQRRAVFAQFRIACDHSDQETVCDYIQYDHCTDDRRFDVVAYIRFHHEKVLFLS